MNKKEHLKSILTRKARLENKRYFDINIGEISREIGCTSNEVEALLRCLQQEKEIKSLVPLGLSKELYALTILENSSILNPKI